jgi:hypothetical protein
MNGTSLSNFNIYYHLSVCPPGKHFWGGLSITRERKSGKPGANHSDLLRFAAQLSWPKKIVSRLIVSTGDSSKHSQPTSPSSIGYLRGDYWAISLRPLAGVGRSMYICLYIYIYHGVHAKTDGTTISYILSRCIPSRLTVAVFMV